MIQKISLHFAAVGLLLISTLTACESTGSGDSFKVADTEDSNLKPTLQAPRVWNGVTVNPTNGRTFVSFNQSDGPGMQLGEVLAGNVIRSYPDTTWNTTDTTKPVATRFIAINAVRYGPDGMLWVVDAGAKSIGKPAAAGGARLFVINTATNIIQKTYVFPANVLNPLSYIDDIRFNGPYVYITDAGHPGLVILNQNTNEWKRRLDGHYSTTDSEQRFMYADNKVTTDEKGQPRFTHADQLEVSPNGRWCYFMPCPGPLYRISTDLLNNFAATEESVRNGVTLFYDGPTTGGTAIAASGTIYYTDPRQRQILKVDTTGKATVFMADKRLLWADAMWIDKEGWLWVPATQQNLTPGFNSGKMEVQYPVWIYKYYLGAERPSPIDHQ